MLLLCFLSNAGPAVVQGNTLKFTSIPPGARYPVKVTVVAWQWGRAVDPKVQSARPVERTLLLTKIEASGLSVSGLGTARPDGEVVSGRSPLSGESTIMTPAGTSPRENVSIAAVAGFASRRFNPAAGQVRQWRSGMMQALDKRAWFWGDRANKTVMAAWQGVVRGD